MSMQEDAWLKPQFSPGPEKKVLRRMEDKLPFQTEESSKDHLLL